jgi:hypothetical protein
MPIIVTLLTPVTTTIVVLVMVSVAVVPFLVISAMPVVVAIAVTFAANLDYAKSIAFNYRICCGHCQRSTCRGNNACGQHNCAEGSHDSFLNCCFYHFDFLSLGFEFSICPGHYPPITFRGLVIDRVLRSPNQTEIGIDLCCLVSKTRKNVSNVSLPAGDNIKTGFIRTKVAIQR